jgi:hypothetical protein
MKSLDGRPLWTCQSTAIRSAPGSESDNPQLRQEALNAAIADIDLRHLPDGSSVRSFQANNDFDGLRRHVVELTRQYNPLPKPSAQPTAPALSAPAAKTVPVASEAPDPVRLKTHLCYLLRNAWIMTRKVKLKSGGELDAIILEETDTAVKMKANTGILSLPKNQINDIEPFGKEEIANNIDKLLEPAKKKFNKEWEYRVCGSLVRELGQKYSVYGPPFPGAFTVRVKKDAESEVVSAVVRSSRERIVVKTGDTIDDFNVIGIDPETDTVLVRMGEGGDILRIWPRPKFD